MTVWQQPNCHITLYAHCTITRQHAIKHAVGVKDQALQGSAAPHTHIHTTTALGPQQAATTSTSTVLLHTLQPSTATQQRLTFFRQESYGSAQPLP